MAQTLELLKGQIEPGLTDQEQRDGSICASPVPEDDENDGDNEENKKGSTKSDEIVYDGLILSGRPNKSVNMCL